VTTPSPWRRVLVDELDALHPRLARYFAAIPEGSVGRGFGVFDEVGSPRRGLRPVLAVLGRMGVLFPVWGHGIPFRVENRPDGELLRARRVLELPTGERVMVDAIGVEGGVLVDRLGRRGTVRAAFDAAVADGALRLRSRATSWRGIPIPFAPTVTLVERFDDGMSRQHVSMTLDARFLGRLYEYSGYFDYAVDDA